MATTHRRILRGAPAHAASGHGGTAVRGHIAATSGRVDRDVANRIGRHGGRICRGGETPLLPVSRTRTVRGIGPHIVGGAGRQPGNAAGETARAAAIGGVAVAHRRIL